MKSAPQGRRPEEVPEIRDLIVQDLHGEMAETLLAWDRISRLQGTVGPTHPDVELAGFDTAKLFWVPPEETAVITHGAQELPDDMTLTPEMIPSPSGFVVFGGDWHGTDSKTGEKTKFPIRAVRWGPVMLPTYFPERNPDGEIVVRGAGVMDDEHPGVVGIALSAYSCTVDMNAAMLKLDDDDFDRSVHGLIPDASLSKEELKNGSGKNSWLPLGRSDWALGENWRDHIIWGPDSIAYESVIEDRCLMAALWGLMASCPPQEILPNRAERRRAERRGSQGSPVSVVTWRGPKGERVATENEQIEADDENRRHLTKRFMVKTHWRHQAHGPGRSLRKWILVPAHWRGPEDGEVADPHEIVHKIMGSK